jgi:hypothetical protein
MSSATFVFDVVSAFLISGYLLYSYSNWFRQRVAVTLAVLVAWYFSFLIVLVLPLDISSTAYKQCVNATLPESSPVLGGGGGGVEEYTTRDPTNIITEKDINSTRTAGGNLNQGRNSSIIA